MPSPVMIRPATRKASVEKWRRSGSRSSVWIFVTSTASSTALTMTRSHRPRDWRRDVAALSVTACGVAYKRLLACPDDVGGRWRSGFGKGLGMRMTMDDGVALEVTDTGIGPGLLLVHGFGGAKEDFADHLDALASRHRVVTFDHRGHGASDKPDDATAYSLDRMAADVLAVADGLGIDTFRLLGHSMGGMVSRRVVLAEPERIDALVLMDTSPGPIPPLHPELAAPAARDTLGAGNEPPPRPHPELAEPAAGIMLEQGKDVLKPMLDEAGTLESPAHLRLLAERPEMLEYEGRDWQGVFPGVGGTLR